MTGYRILGCRAVVIALAIALSIALVVLLLFILFRPSITTPGEKYVLFNHARRIGLALAFEENTIAPPANWDWRNIYKKVYGEEDIITMSRDGISVDTSEKVRDLGGAFAVSGRKYVGIARISDGMFILFDKSDYHAASDINSIYSTSWGIWTPMPIERLEEYRRRGLPFIDSATFVVSDERSISSPIFDESTSAIERMKAVDALPRTQPPEALAALRSLLKDAGENEALRNNVANKLRECGDPNLVADLTAMLWDENETPKWRNYCVQHLYQCYADKPDPAVLDTLFQAAEADERMVRICAVWSLARVATPHDKSKAPGEETLSRTRALALLALREKDAHFLITTAGVQSCARLGMAEALPDIRALASSDGTKPVSLRIAAVAALGELKDTESLPLLERLSREAAGQLQLAARLALKRISEAEARGEATVPPEADRPEDKF